MKNKKILGALFFAILGVGWIARYVVRDINLNVDVLLEGIEKMPAIMMENLDFEREISGDFWRAHIPRAALRGGVAEVTSIDVTRFIEGEGGKEWYFRSASGFYSEKIGSADLFGLLGTLETDARMLNLESPRLSFLGYGTSRDKNAEYGDYEFLFPDGLIVYDAEIRLAAPSAKLNKDGVILLEGGVAIKWKKQLENHEMDAQGAVE
ncbi:hypothetical protein FACS1894187_08580 [Synergistales bacterium]|nr:hypothetical protein FACS1894187_08580 [Synergistales bacterium]